MLLVVRRFRGYVFSFSVLPVLPSAEWHLNMTQPVKLNMAVIMHSLSHISGGNRLLLKNFIYLFLSSTGVALRPFFLIWWAWPVVLKVILNWIKQDCKIFIFVQNQKFVSKTNLVKILFFNYTKSSEHIDPCAYLTTLYPILNIQEIFLCMPKLLITVKEV